MEPPPRKREMMQVTWKTVLRLTRDASNERNFKEWSLLFNAKVGKLLPVSRSLRFLNERNEEFQVEFPLQK